MLSTKAHPVRVPDAKNADRIRNPKKALNRLFKQHTGKPYVDRWHALGVKLHVVDFGGQMMDLMSGIGKFIPVEG